MNMKLVTRFPVITAVLLLTMVICLQSVEAIDEFDLDLDFLRELSRIEFNDYAELQLAQMQKKYPDKKDIINLEKARVFYSLGRSREADAALAAIPKDSALRNDVFLLKAQVFAARRNWAEADKVFKQYFAANQKPASNKKSDANTFKQAVMIYNMVLKSMNKPAEAAKILDLLANVKGAVDERQMEFLKLQTAIDAEESKLLSGGTINAAAIAAAIKGMENLQFIRDGVAASASVQLARANILLGRSKLLTWLKNEEKNKANIAKLSDFANAVRTIDMIYPRLEELEKSLGLANTVKSPVVEAMFYKAIAFASHAAVTHAKGETEKARNQVRGAATYLERILQEYPDSSFQNRALTEHEACSKFSEAKFGEKIELRQGGNAAIISSSLEKADAFLQQKNYKAAYPFCLAALRAGRLSSKLPDIGLRLIMCLAEMDDLNGADALLDYLSIMFPQAEGTADAALRLGAMLLTRSRDEKNPARNKELNERAMLAFDKFVTAAPAHPRAPDIAFTIAESLYQAASTLALATNKEKNEAEKLKLQQKTLAAFRVAVPKYQRMVDSFSVFDKGIRSLYKLGWCYDALDEKEKATEMFLSYYDSENDRKYANDRLQAKFRAAYLLLYGEHPNDAIVQFEELLSVLGKKDSGFDLTGSVALQIKEDSASLLPWAFHLTAEKLRPALTIFQRRQSTLQERIDSYKTLLSESEAEREQAAKEQAALEKDLLELKKVFTDFSFDFAEMARKQLAEHGEDTSKMSEAEKQMHQQTVAATLKERAALLEQQKKNELIGTLATQEKRRDDAVTGKGNAEKHLAKLEAEKLDITSQIRELQKNITTSRNKAAGLSAAISDTEKQLTLVDADRQTAQSRKSEIEAKVDDSQGAEKEKWQQELERVNADYNAINEKFQEAFAKHQQATSEQAKKEIAEQERRVVELTEEVHATEADLKRCENAIELAKIDIRIAEAEQLAAARYLALAKVYQDNLAKNDDLRKAALPELDKERETAVQAASDLCKIRSSKFSARNQYLTLRDQYCRESISETEVLVQKLNQDIDPIRKQFTEWKGKAVSGLTDFLQKYSSSSKVPDNMSMLGSIYLFDLNEPVKAADILRQLAAEHPKAQATQKAMFMLGRAQAENGKVDEASKSFAKLLDKPEEIALGNLLYVSDVCLKANLADAAATANREILKRAATPNHPDAAQLTKGIQERAGFALGRSLVALKRYPEAIKILEKILEDNERTAYFFDIKFLLAEARANTNPPDWAALEKDLYDILMLATSPVMRNRASCYYAEALLRSNDPAKRSAALSNFQLVLLADPKIPENRDFIERALYGSAKIYAADGKTAEAADMVKRYRELFSGGKYQAELKRLGL